MLMHEEPCLIPIVKDTSTGLRSVNREVRSYSQNNSKYPQTIRMLSFGTTKVAVYANNIFVCLFVSKTEKMFTALIVFI